MRNRSSGLLSPLALALVVVAACSAGAAPPASGGSASPGGTTGPVDPLAGQIAAGLRVSITQSGGFAGPNFVAYPEVAVYADGRVIEPGAVPAIYPGPLLPSLLQTLVTPAGVARVLDLAHTDGLADHDQAYPARGVADAPDTVIVVVVDGRAITARFGALGVSGGSSGDATETTARAAAQDFVTRLTGYPGVLAADQVGQSQPYVPAEVAITAVRGDPSANVQPSLLVRQPLAWPLATPLADFGSAAVVLPSQPPVQRCGVVDGADLRLLWPLLQQATQITGFASEGLTWTVTPRPLLPGETATCVGRTDQRQVTPSASTLSAWSRIQG